MTYTKALPIPAWDNLSEKSQTTLLQNFIADLPPSTLLDIITEGACDCNPDDLVSWFDGAWKSSFNDDQATHPLVVAIVSKAVLWYEQDCADAYERERAGIKNGEYDG